MVIIGRKVILEGYITRAYDDYMSALAASVEADYRKKETRSELAQWVNAEKILNPGFSFPEYVKQIENNESEELPNE